MTKFIVFVFLTLLISSCSHSQNPSLSDGKLVGGLCEGCEAVFEFGDRKMMAVATLPDFDKDGPKLKVTGTVYQSDGKTPAKDVILYVYHTDQGGIYPTRGDERGWAKRHGYLREWIKTDGQGRYTFYTRKPAPYPGRSVSAHIHVTFLESSGKYYWLSSYLFADDPLLSEKEKAQKNPRGGTSGLLVLKKEGEMWVGSRDFVLGKNIPNYEQ